jgi:nucleotide-binding universal stress UspA family protein
MYNKILAPMDGSSLSECIIEHVKEIAKGCGVAQFIFLAVVDYAKNSWAWVGDGGMGGGYLNADIVGKLMEAQKDKAKEYLSRLVEEAKKDGLDAESVITEGYPPDAIIDYANKNGVDLIVMSSHGRSGITRFALGSVTDKVLRTSAVPVMVVSPAGCKGNV